MSNKRVFTALANHNLSLARDSALTHPELSKVFIRHAQDYARQNPPVVEDTTYYHEFGHVISMFAEGSLNSLLYLNFIGHKSWKHNQVTNAEVVRTIFPPKSYEEFSSVMAEYASGLMAEKVAYAHSLLPQDPNWGDPGFASDRSEFENHAMSFIQHEGLDPATDGDKIEPLVDSLMQDAFLKSARNVIKYWPAIEPLIELAKNKPILTQSDITPIFDSLNFS